MKPIRLEDMKPYGLTILVNVILIIIFAYASLVRGLNRTGFGFPATPEIIRQDILIIIYKVITIFIINIVLYLKRNKQNTNSELFFILCVAVSIINTLFLLFMDL